MFLVLLELLDPEIRSGLWNCRLATVRLMVPKATVDEDYGLPRWKNDIRAVGEVVPVQTESIAECV